MLVPLGAAGGEPRVVEAGDGRRFAVFPVEDGFRVIDAECPHKRGPLAEGVRTGTTLQCPWHWYRFDLDSGACPTDPRLRVGVHPVLRRDGEWFAEVGAKPAELSWSQRLRAHARDRPIAP